MIDNSPEWMKEPVNFKTFCESDEEALLIFLLQSEASFPPSQTVGTAAPKS